MARPNTEISTLFSYSQLLDKRHISSFCRGDAKTNELTSPITHVTDLRHLHMYELLFIYFYIAINIYRNKYMVFGFFMSITHISCSGDSCQQTGSSQSHASPEIISLALEGPSPARSETGYTMTGLYFSPRQQHATAAAYRSSDTKDGSSSPRSGRHGSATCFIKNVEAYFSFRQRRPSLAGYHDTPVSQASSH